VELLSDAAMSTTFKRLERIALKVLGMTVTLDTDSGDFAMPLLFVASSTNKHAQHQLWIVLKHL